LQIVIERVFVWRHCLRTVELQWKWQAGVKKANELQMKEKGKAHASENYETVL